MIGYDNWKINHQILLDLPFMRATGTVLDDVSILHNPFNYIGGPPDLWTALASDLQVLELTPQPTARWLQGSGDDYDFTTEDFSLGIWLNGDADGILYDLVWFGNHSTNGYALDKRATDDFEFTTYNAGPASQSTISSVAYAAGSWMLIGVSRSGADVMITKNGEDITLTAGTHIDPGAVGAGTFYISDGSPAAVDGKIWRPRIWDRALSAAEWLHIFELERHWFGA